MGLIGLFACVSLKFEYLRTQRFLVSPTSHLKKTSYCSRLFFSFQAQNHPQALSTEQIIID